MATRLWALTQAAQELTEIEFKRMFAQAKEDFMDVSKAKVGDKTLVDAFYPAVSAIAETEGSIEALLDAAAEAAQKGADETADMTAKFGRAKNVGERSLGHKDGHKDPGAVSMAIFFAGLAKGARA